uniref:Uncharacterized protein n=1 Tax=Strigamia maritima TaxID=126957 RepID=T1J4I8_STRMM
MTIAQLIRYGYGRERNLFKRHRVITVAPSTNIILNVIDIRPIKIQVKYISLNLVY